MTHFHRRTVLKLVGVSASTAVWGDRAMAQGLAPAPGATPASQASDKTLCERLAEYVVGLRFESFPDEVVSKTKDVILHNLASSFGGVGTDQYNKAVEFVERRAGPATIIGQRFKTSVSDA